MLRVLTGLCFICILGTVLTYAGDAYSPPATASPPPGTTYPTTNQPQETPIISPAAATAPSKPFAQTKSKSQLKKQAIESLLKTPANVDFGDRSKVTVQEIFDALHKQHHLSIRCDIPTLSVLLGAEAAYNFDAIESRKPDKPSPDASVSTVSAQQEKPSPTKDEESPLIAILMRPEVKIQHIDTKRVQIATLIRHALDAVPSISELTTELAGIPLRPYNADLIDFLVEEDGILLTTRMNALTVKETRVYLVANLSGPTTEQLATVIRQAIRPWSWRSHINDLGEQLTTGLPKQLPQQLSSVLSSGIQIAAATTGIGLQPVYATDANCTVGCCTPPATSPNMPTSPAPYASTPPPMTSSVQISPMQATVPSAADAAVAVKFLVNGLITAAQSTLSALEMLHFSEPPTGTIHSLPKLLVVTQSQAAHREIADLLTELGFPPDAASP